MKKDTVATLLDKLERQAKRVQDEALRQAQINAVNQCRTWLNLTWAEMLSPVNAKLATITAEVQPLLEKEAQQQPLTEEEARYLQRARDMYGIYQQFQRKIHPTAFRASVERHIRERERTERK